MVRVMVPYYSQKPVENKSCLNLCERKIFILGNEKTFVKKSLLRNIKMCILMFGTIGITRRNCNFIQ
jgi:hypothetical protein